MLKSELIFVRFDANETSRRFSIDSRAKSVRSVHLKAISHQSVNTTAVLVQMHGSSSAVGSEGLVGFPVPTFRTGAGAAGNQYGGLVLEDPWKMADVNWPGTQNIEIKLRNVTGGTLTHNGINLWLLLRCERETVDFTTARAGGWNRVATAAAGAYDGRWDYVPSASEMAENQRILEERFSPPKPK